MIHKLCTCVILVGSAGLASASVWTTPAGALNGVGSAVSAQAVFTAGAGTLTIDLSNLLTASQVLNVGQNVSDLFFTLDSNDTSGTVVSSTATFVNVGTGGAVTSASVAGTDKMGWSFHYNPTSGFHLDGLDDATFVPKHTILGGTAGSFDPYSNSNSSIKNNNAHNPFAQGTGHFVLSIAGVTENTRVKSATFSFGTTAGDNVAGTPEPASLAALGIGAIGLFRRRARKA